MLVLLLLLLLLLLLHLHCCWLSGVHGQHGIGLSHLIDAWLLSGNP
jgi:hypothetical protein